MSKSGVTYLHQQHVKDIKNGKLVEIEESVIDGPKGVSFKYFHKTDSSTEKYLGKQTENGEFFFLHVKDGQKDTMNLSLADLIKEVKKVKELAFVVKYLTSAKGQERIKGGKRRSRSRSTSRKGSKGSKASKSKSKSKSRSKPRAGSMKGGRRGKRTATKSKSKSKSKGRRGSKRRAASRSKSKSKSKSRSKGRRRAASRSKSKSKSKSRSRKGRKGSAKRR